MKKRKARRNGYSPADELYNAAVSAVHAAASSLARDRAPGSRDPWLNETGCYAFVDDVATLIAEPREIERFAELTKGWPP